MLVREAGFVGQVEGEVQALAGEGEVFFLLGVPEHYGLFYYPIEYILAITVKKHCSKFQKKSNGK